MSATIALLNMKGGVGKTTLAVNLSYYLSRRANQKVLLVDLDPQFNSSQYLMSFDAWDTHRKKNGTVADLLIEPLRRDFQIKKRTRKSRTKGATQIFHLESQPGGGQLDILPSELELARTIKNPDRVAYKLEKALKRIRQEYDYIFIDCAPTDSILTDTALMATDYVLVPIKPDRFSVLGYAQIQSTLTSFRDAYPDPHGVQDLGVVFTQVQGGSRIEEECIVDVSQQADYVFRTTIPVSKSYLRSVHEQTPVFDTTYARSVTKNVIRDLVKEIEDRMDALCNARG